MAEPEVLAEVDRLVALAEQQNLVWVAVRELYQNDDDSAHDHGLAFMGAFTSLAAAQECCQTNYSRVKMIDWKMRSAVVPSFTTNWMEWGGVYMGRYTIEQREVNE